MTELNDLMKGYEWREKVAMQKLSWHAANVINPHIKRSVTPNQLLGLDKPQTDEEKHKQLDKLKQQLAKIKGAEKDG